MDNIEDVEDTRNLPFIVVYMIGMISNFDNYEGMNPEEIWRDIRMGFMDAKRERENE